ARYNINDSKMFYVITSKEKEVKDYIIHTLGYELTELDVKGGFSKQKKSIILSVISAKDYYRLRAGIINIDSKAFVAITDTYDVINRKAF
ncbi:MAG: YitT family protein, partial [Bacilli bacterium]|nr:YitT family protein [Bacilli bacterium]